MKSKDIRKLSVELRKKYRIQSIDVCSIRKIIEGFGYIIIEFNPVQNDEDTSVVIERLDLTDYIIRHTGFTYADADCRVVFVQKDLDSQEKTIVLSHELGHIVCNHLNHAPILGTSVIEEDEANQFANSLLRPVFTDMVKIYAGIFRKQLAICCCLLMLVSGLVSLYIYGQKQASYYGDYFITENGEKYHEAGCMFVKDKKNVHRLTIEEFESGKYAPCQMCLPN